MKLTLTALAAVIGCSSAAKEITSNSPLGKSILSKARRLENQNNNQNQEYNFNWVANYSLKFQGCYNIPKWNDEVDGEDDVRVSNSALVRVRLCPTNTCSQESAYGCKEGYGDYVIDMATFLQAYFESVQQDQEYNCQYEEQYGDCAACANNGGNDNYSEEMCMYDCYMGKGMEYCIENNPYAQDGDQQQQQRQDLREMAECQRFEWNNNNGRKLDGNNNWQQEYSMGPFCAEDGGSIKMGLFTDETCTNFADSNYGATTFASLTYGQALPYSETTMIGTECMSCKEPQEQNQNNQNDQQDEDQVKEGCEQIYQQSAKCEAGLSGVTYYQDNSGCTYMQGIKIIRRSGGKYTYGTSKNKVATAFIAIFGISFVGLAVYTYYLKTKLDRAKINLSE
jgi:hypothetical protein